MRDYHFPELLHNHHHHRKNGRDAEGAIIDAASLLANKNEISWEFNQEGRDCRVLYQGNNTPNATPLALSPIPLNPYLPSHPLISLLAHPPMTHTRNHRTGMDCIVCNVSPCNSEPRGTA